MRACGLLLLLGCQGSLTSAKDLGGDQSGDLSTTGAPDLSRTGNPDGGNGDGGSTPSPSPATGHPKLVSPDQIQAVVSDTTDWSSRLQWCDDNLSTFIGSGYVGSDWYDAMLNYTMCLNGAKALNLAVDTQQHYSDKLLALMRVMARDQAYGTPDTGDELVAVGDGSTKAFTLRMPAAAGATVKVFIAPLTEKSFMYSGTTTDICSDFCFDVIAKISDSSGGAPAYTRSVDYHEGYPTLLHWLSGNHPASNATFYASIADQPFNAVAAGQFTVSGTTLTLTTAPAATQAVFVSYLGPAYAQTGNGMGGVESIKPDSHFPMRFMNVGLAWGFDTLVATPALTGALRSEYSLLLAQEVDDYMETTGINPYLDTPLSNYYIEGELTGTVSSTYAIDDDLTTTPHGLVLKDLASMLVLATTAELDKRIPGGYGYEGTYTNGTVNDLMKVFSIWRYAAGQDVVSPLQWTANVISTTIHGIKPDRMTFYDGGDWNDLPATPLADVLRSFQETLPTHPMSPFARQALADIGQPLTSGTLQDYKSGAGAFPLSTVAKGTGPVYARSDWGTTAEWLSMSVGPVFSLGHEHLDRGHITLQRGADYLLKDSGDYGAYDTVPWHNTLGFGAGAAPSQCGGDDGGMVTPPRYVEGGGFVYAQEDMTRSYCNGVDRAVRTLVYVRPDMVVVHDQATTTAAGTLKAFNLNFGAAITQAADIFSTVVGGSKLFMHALVPANPTPTITPDGTSITGANGAFALKGYNYRVSTSGQTADTFLHVFQMTGSGQAQMTPSAYVKSADARAQGAAVSTGGNAWVILSSISGATLTGTLTYPLPLTCPCSFVIGDLTPNASVQAAIYDNSGGGPIATQTVTVNGQGVLTFTTASGAADHVTLTGL